MTARSGGFSRANLAVWLGSLGQRVRRLAMDEYTKELIESARAMYKDVVAGDDSRIQRGKILWDQFEAAAEACRTGGKENERQLGERINELAVATVIADDKQLRGPITYEPNLLPSKRKIDFVADRLRDNLYVEVKTVHPDTADTEEAWNNYLKLREHGGPPQARAGKSEEYHSACSQVALERVIK